MAPSPGIFAGGVSANVHFKDYRRECARYRLAVCAWPAFGLWDGAKGDLIARPT
jgi:hypothetical protein